MRLNWKDRVKYPVLASKTNPASRQCFSKTTIIVLILGKICHKVHPRKSGSIRCRKGNVPSSYGGCKVIKSNTNAKIFNTTAWISCTSIFIYNNDSKVDLIADLRKFNYAIVCHFETV